MPDTLLVIGIHREELPFGDRIAEKIDPERIDVMRIDRGISNSYRRGRDEFYRDALHREIYLQLLQQVKKRYKLVIDLHCGRHERGQFAEIFSHDKALMHSLDTMTTPLEKEQMRLIRIVAEKDSAPHHAGDASIEPRANTLIPRRIWDNSEFCYVGLEIYLGTEEKGSLENRDFACSLIDTLYECVH